MNNNQSVVISKDDNNISRAIAQVHERYTEFRKQLGKVIVGMEDVTEQLMMAILCRGHCILQGMPGLAKTLLISQFSSLMELSFHRIQFTPDLMPSDITGGEVLEENRSTGKREFRFVKGPVFANLLLADEINRTPPKTQPLDAMYQFVEEGRTAAALDVLFNHIDDMLCDGDFQKCDDVIQRIDLERLDTNLLVGVLSITLAAREKLSRRAQVVQAIRKRLEILAPGRVEALMSELE